MAIEPEGVGINPSTNKIYITSPSNPTVRVIDGFSNTIMANIMTGLSNNDVGVNPISNRIYVTHGTSSVSLIDGNTDTVIFPISVSGTDVTFGVGVNPLTNGVYVGNTTSTVFVISGNTNTVLATIPVGSGPRRIGILP